MSAPPISKLVVPRETAYDLFRRFCTPSWRTGLPVIDDGGPFGDPAAHRGETSGGAAGDGGPGAGKSEIGLHAGEVVELYGDPNVGKTELLLHLVASCVLPAAAGGLARPALFFDHDCRLDLHRLRQVLQHRLGGGGGGVGGGVGGAGVASGVQQQPQQQQQQQLDASLSRVHVYRCHSSFEVVATLAHLRGGPLLRAGSGTAALLALDGLGAFHWQDKRTEAVSGSGPALLSQVAEAVARTIAATPIAVVATKPRLFSSRDKPHCEYLPQRWQRLVSRRLLLERAGGGGGGGVGGGGGRSDGGVRSSVALYSATLIWAAGQHGGEGERHRAVARGEALAAHRKAALFRRHEFCITDAGVQFQSPEGRPECQS